MRSCNMCNASTKKGPKEMATIGWTMRAVSETKIGNVCPECSTTKLKELTEIKIEYITRTYKKDLEEMT